MSDLLTENDPDPVGLERPMAPSQFLIIADHAGNAIPSKLADLGLGRTDLDRHIGIDIGILEVSRHMSEMLDATLIHQRYSRLVIDCNRPPLSPGSIMPVSDRTTVPGNQALDEAAVQARIDTIFWPYQNRIRDEIDHRFARDEPPIIIAMHSFTPHHGDFPAPRPWQIGVLFNRDERLARPVIAHLEAEGDLTVGINQPYGVDDDGDYAVPVHCEARGLIHVEFEIRQDLIGDKAGQKAWAKRLADILLAAVKELPAMTLEQQNAAE
jgi:predicted N-formylglutamate amidohydrolase